MFDSVKTLPKDLRNNIYQRGYFFLSTRDKSQFWVDLYALSHLFNSSEMANEYRCFLKELMREIIIFQKKEFKINSVIISRWACSTEDLFSETLLNIYFELFRENRENDDFKDLTIYELFNSGNGNYYLSPVYSDKMQERINAIAFLALDIHFDIIQRLMKANKGVDISVLISVIGRCDPDSPRVKNCGFDIVPLFNASKIEKNLDEFHFIMNTGTLLYKRLFINRDYKKYIPYENWEKRYKNG